MTYEVPVPMPAAPQLHLQAVVCCRLLFDIFSLSGLTSCVCDASCIPGRTGASERHGRTRLKPAAWTESQGSAAYIPAQGAGTGYGKGGEEEEEVENTWVQFVLTIYAPTPAFDRYLNTNCYL